MAKPQIPQNTPQASAQKYFSKADQQSETLVKQARKKERAVSAAKTANLRELRLAKEAADKVAEAADLKAKPAIRRPKQSKRPPVRMIY